MAQIKNYIELPALCRTFLSENGTEFIHVLAIGIDYFLVVHVHPLKEELGMVETMNSSDLKKFYNIKL